MATMACFFRTTPLPLSLLSRRPLPRSNSNSNSCAQSSGSFRGCGSAKAIGKLESLFYTDSGIPQEKIERPTGLSKGLRAIGNHPWFPECEAKGVVECATCAGSGLYVNSVLESQGIIVKTRLGTRLGTRIELYATESDEEPYGTSEIETTGWRSLWIVQWARTKIVNPVLVILRRGTEPKQLAFSAALGFTLGVFPIYGITTFISGVVLTILGSRCNGPTLILANLLATPFELGLMIPFLRVGESLVGSNPFPLTKNALRQAITGKASGDLLFAIGHAILGWLFVGPFLCLPLYFILLPVTRWSQRRFGGQDRVPSERVVLLNEEVLGKKDLGSSRKWTQCFPQSATLDSDFVIALKCLLP